MAMALIHCSQDAQQPSVWGQSDRYRLTHFFITFQSFMEAGAREPDRPGSQARGCQGGACAEYLARHAPGHPGPQLAGGHRLATSAVSPPRLKRVESTGVQAGAGDPVRPAGVARVGPPRRASGRMGRTGPGRRHALSQRVVERRLPASALSPPRR